MAFSSKEVSATETILNESSAQDIPELLKAHEDRYDGVVVEIENENIHNDVAHFVSSLKASLSQWTHQAKKGAWIKVPIEQAKLVPAAIEERFCYHHAEPSYVMLVYWIPANASHHVGIAAFVFNDGEVLVVQEKHGPYKDSGLWKIPTGRIKQGEGINNGAIREVKEETWIDADFLQMVGFRDRRNAAFGKSNILFMCVLKSHSSDILIQDSEISAGKVGI